MPTNDLPAMPFYFGDWNKDNIKGCSLAARGLWFELLGIMWSSERRGYLQINGKPMTPEQLCRRVGCERSEFDCLLLELENAGVPSRTEDGIIFSRRMVRDEAYRADKIRAGQLGGKQSAKQRSSTTPSKVASTSASKVASKVASTSASKVASKPQAGGKQNPETEYETEYEDETPIRGGIRGGDGQDVGSEVNTPPTLTEVKAHADRFGITAAEAEGWWQFNQARGWIIGASRVRDWKALLACDVPKIQERRGVKHGKANISVSARLGGTTKDYSGTEIIRDAPKFP